MTFDPAALNWQYVPRGKRFTTAASPDWGGVGTRAQPNPDNRDTYELTKERGRLILIRTRGDKGWTLGKFTGLLGDGPIQILLSELREQITSQIERRELALVRLLKHLDDSGMGWTERGERLVPMAGDVLGMSVVEVSLMPSPHIKDHWEILGEAPVDERPRQHGGGGRTQAARQRVSAGCSGTGDAKKDAHVQSEIRALHALAVQKVANRAGATAATATLSR
jgi:hypothetical protein